LNSIQCVRCLAMGFLLESPVQLADSQVLHLSPHGVHSNQGEFATISITSGPVSGGISGPKSAVFAGLHQVA
jgi:hypothetical protein